MPGLALLPWVLLGLIAGCSTDPGTPHPNKPPDTIVTYAGPVDAVNSHVRLRWWGEDPDGQIAGFEYRWTYENVGPGDWVFTVATTDSFAMPAPEERAEHLFEVRAIDDTDERDPSPATQLYAFWNQSPHLRFASESQLPEASLPAVTIEFVATDPDGDDTVQETVAWLDGQDAASEGKRVPYPESLVTFGPDDFDRYGERTVFLLTLDDGFAPSDTISHTLEIVEPIGDVILFDDMPDNIAGGVTHTDPFYREAMDEIMAGTPYTIHKIEVAPLRTEEEALAIFGLFETVIWYQGTNTVDAQGNPVPISTFSLSKAGPAIRALLDRGGRMYLSTMNAIGHLGAFDETFAREVLGVDSIQLNPDGTGPDDTNFFLQTRYYTGQPLWDLAGRGEEIYDDVRIIGNFWGVELFSAVAGVDVVYEIPENIVFEEQQRAAVGTRLHGTGTMIYLGMPLSRCSYQRRHEVVIRSILRDELDLP